MIEAPELPSRPLLTRSLAIKTFLFFGLIEGAFGLISFFVYYWAGGWRPFDTFHGYSSAFEHRATTMTFLGIVAGQIGCLFANRGGNLRARLSFRSNGWILVGLGFESGYPSSLSMSPGSTRLPRWARCLPVGFWSFLSARLPSSPSTASAAASRPSWRTGNRRLTRAHRRRQDSVAFTRRELSQQGRTIGPFGPAGRRWKPTRSVGESMSIVGDQLSEWQAAGLLDAESCARIAQYEQAKKPARSAQPVLIELFAYLGLIIVGAGVVVLVAVNWDRLGGVARIATLALPGIALLPLGRLLSTSREQGLRRGGSIAWLLALTLVTGAVGVTGHELTWDGESAALAAGIVSAFAFVLWWFNRDHAQVAGLAAAAVLLSIGAAAFDARYLSDANTVTLLGLALLIQFGLGSVFVRLGALTPRNTAGVVALYGLAAGAPCWSQPVSACDSMAFTP